MRTLLSLATFCLLIQPLLTAQVKGSFRETSICGFSTVHQSVIIDDDRQHSVSLDQKSCRSDVPIEIAGLTGSGYVAYGVDDVQSGRSIDRGYVVGTMKNGDRYFLRYEGTAIMNGNIPSHLEGNWSFTGGSGKLKHLQGSGTYTAHPTAQSGMQFVIQGNYELP